MIIVRFFRGVYAPRCAKRQPQRFLGAGLAGASCHRDDAGRAARAGRDPKPV